MSIYKRGGIWWLDVGIRGRPRVRRSCETGDRERAQAIHDEVRAQLRRINPSGRTLHGALQAWGEAARRDPADGYRLDKLIQTVADQPLDTLDGAALIASIPASSPATFNRYANIIAAACRLVRHPIEIPHRRVTEKRLRWLTAQEWRRLRKELPDHLRAMAEFALLTGLRQRNVSYLEWSQVDLARSVLWIHADQAKARRSLGIPLSTAARDVLTRQRGQHEQWVFPYRGRPIRKIKSAWRKALARAGLAGVTWHTLRHTWASWHAMSGTPIPALRELGGWSTLSMVSRYTHLAPEHLRRYAGNVTRFSRHSPRHKAGKK